MKCVKFIFFILHLVAYYKNMMYLCTLKQIPLFYNGL